MGIKSSHLLKQLCTQPKRCDKHKYATKYILNGKYGLLSDHIHKTSSADKTAVEQLWNAYHNHISVVMHQSQIYVWRRDGTTLSGVTSRFSSYATAEDINRFLGLEPVMPLLPWIMWWVITRLLPSISYDCVSYHILNSSLPSILYRCHIVVHTWILEVCKLSVAIALQF